MRWLGIAAGVVLIGVAVGLFFLYSQTEVEAALKRGEWVHVLVVGLDNGAQGQVQADLVGIASLAPDGKAVWLTVPRELEFPENGEWRPLYATYDGDPSRLAAAIGGMLELSIPYWAVVDFDGFRKLVDEIGEIEVIVESRLRYSDRSQNLEIDIPAGQNQLNGEKALEYLRYRAEGGNEPSRAVRTEKFIAALWKKLRGLPWSRWRELARIAQEHLTTNLSIWESLALLARVRSLDGDRITFAICPIDPRSNRPDLAGIRKLTDSLYRGQGHLLRSDVKVAVLNGTGVRFLASRTRVWLLKRGFQVVMMGNADRSDYPRTVLVYRDGAQEKAAMLAGLLPGTVETMKADTFGVERLGGWPEGADLILVLGKGFDVKP
jgi:LCP family protein required for cell wall assembly